MDNGDIERFLAQLTPAQETVALLKEVSAKLSDISVKLTELVVLAQPKPETLLKPTVAANARGMDGKKRQ